MTANKPSPFVPKRRFPEFRDGPEWEEVTLGTLLDRPPDYGVNAAAVPFSETLPTYIRITDINDDSQFAPCPRVSVDIDATDEQYLEDGDIVLARTGASVGKSYRYREEDGRLVYAGFLIRVRPNPERLLSQFLAAYLSTWNYWDWVRLTSARSGQPGINATEYASIPLPLPPDRRILAEQQKIADCLGSLDDLIAAENQKLEALREHKQGLMQQIFPQPGETVPRLRFPEFREEGAWEETMIGNMGEVITGSTPSTSRRDFYGGDFMFVSPADISDLRFVEETKTTLTEAGFAECRPVKKNSVLFVCIGSTIGKVAQCSRPCATNQQINSLVASPEFVADFAYYLLDRESVRIARLASKQAVPIINKSLFAAVRVTTPVFAEQQRIADCLTSLDDRLNAQVRKLDTLKQHKQGLLQQLFPSLKTK